MGELLQNAELLFRTDTALQIAWVLVFVLGGLWIFFLRRFIRSRPHVHQWKNVVYMTGYGGSSEVDQVCECKARRKVVYWPPPEHEE